MLKNKKYEGIWQSTFTSVIALVMAILVGAIIIAAIGKNPIEAYGALLKGAFGTPAAFTVTLTKSVPLILSGLAIALAFKCSVFNIGVEGQLLVGAMAAAIAGVYIKLPAVLHILVVILCAAAAGALWAFVPALLKKNRNVNVVISTIMFNYIGQYLVQYLILGPFAAGGEAAATKNINPTAVLPKLLPPPFVLNFGIIIAVISIIVVYILLNKTSLGYEMRAVGFNRHAAKTNGINVESNMFLALLLSGALAGIGGGIEVMGSLGKIVNGFSPGYGFNGIPVALMARNNPFVIFLTALLMGSMKSGSLMMQSSVGISKNMVDVIQGLVVVFLCAEYFISYYINKMRKKGGK